MNSMVKNLKRYKRDQDKEASSTTFGSRDRKSSHKSVLDFVPVTYTLPADYSLFVEEFRRNPHSLWIMKPSARARGIGIFIITKLSQVKKWQKEKWSVGSSTARNQYVVSRYIDRPLLVGGRKFDLRLYVLVTCYRPLRVYAYHFIHDAI